LIFINAIFAFNNVIDNDKMEEVARIYMQIENDFLKFQNGVISNEMKQAGIEYKINYGVSISDIDKMAGSFSKNNNLAFYCWKQEIRESKLLAVRLIDYKTIDKSQINDLLAGITNTELAEQIASHFFVNLPDNLTFLDDIFKFGNEFVVYAGLLTILKKLKTGSLNENENCKKYFELIQNLNLPDKIYVKRTLTSILLKMSEVDEIYKKEILKWIKNFKFVNQNFKNYIESEVLYYLKT
jgi:3-methyladenine DNA glycosylase AlkD